MRHPAAVLDRDDPIVLGEVEHAHPAPNNRQLDGLGPWRRKRRAPRQSRGSRSLRMAPTASYRPGRRMASARRAAKQPTAALTPDIVREKNLPTARAIFCLCEIPGFAGAAKQLVSLRIGAPGGSSFHLIDGTCVSGPRIPAAAGRFARSGPSGATLILINQNL
jgi:hypothetical protein